MEKSAKIVLALGIIFTLILADVTAVSLQTDFYPYGTNAGDSVLQHTGSSSQATLQVGNFNFYGSSYSSLSVSSDNSLAQQ